MAVDRIVINGGTVRQILNSGAIQSQLGSLARGIAGRAGPGKWNVYVESGPKRARAAVVTGDRKARVAEGKTRALSRSVGGRA